MTAVTPQPETTDEPTADATFGDKLREAFDHAKEATYSALSDIGQEAENEAELAEKSISAFLTKLIEQGESHIAKAAETLKVELDKIL